MNKKYILRKITSLQTQLEMAGIEPIDYTAYSGEEFYSSTCVNVLLDAMRSTKDTKGVLKDALAMWEGMKSEGNHTIHAGLETPPAGQKLVNGVLTPDISISPDELQFFYRPAPGKPTWCDEEVFSSHSEIHCRLRKYGMCYPYTEQGKQAAIRHAKAGLVKTTSTS